MSEQEAKDTAKPRYRYPGTQAFQDSDIDRMLFYGRAPEAKELFHAILGDPLTLLTGKSGLGKTSLLHAAIFPDLRDQGFAVLTARFNRVPDLSISTVEFITERFAEDCRSHGLEIEEGDRTRSLWEYLKTTTVWDEDKLLQPIIVCDQFEEIFTTQPEERRREIMQELGPVIRGVMPEAVRKLFHPDKTPPFTEAPPAIKVVFSLRHEYVALLESFSQWIPKILDNLILLKPLSREAACESITMPALAEDHSFLCPRFSYSDVELGNILNFLGMEDSKDGFGSGVEPLRLQMICRHIERRLIGLHQHYENDTPQMYVPSTFLGGTEGMKHIVAQFYADALKTLPSRADARKAQRLCDTALISSRGTQNRRITVEIESLKADYDVEVDLIKALERERILKRELIRDQVLLELSHDSLIEPVLEAKRQRQTTIKRRCFAGVISAVAVPLITLFVWTNLKASADKQDTKAEYEKVYAEAERAKEEARAAYAAKDEAEIKANIERKGRETEAEANSILTEANSVSDYRQSNLQTIADEGLRLKKDLEEFLLTKADQYDTKALLVEALKLQFGVISDQQIDELIQTAETLENLGDYVGANRAWNSAYSQALTNIKERHDPRSEAKVIHCFSRASYWNWNRGEHQRTLQMVDEMLAVFDDHDEDHDDSLMAPIEMARVEAITASDHALTDEQMKDHIDKLSPMLPESGLARLQLQTRISALLLSRKDPATFSDEDWDLIDANLPDVNIASAFSEPMSQQQLLVYADVLFWNGRSHVEAFHPDIEHEGSDKSLGVARRLFQRLLEVTSMPKEEAFIHRQLKLRHHWARMGLCLTEARDGNWEKAQAWIVGLADEVSSASDAWTMWDVTAIRAHWLTGTLGPTSSSTNQFLDALNRIDLLKFQRRFPANYGWWTDTIGAQAFPGREATGAIIRTNHLDMKLIHLPGSSTVRMAIWETRVSDYQSFVTEAGYPAKPAYRFYPKESNGKRVWSRPDTPDSNWEKMREVYNQTPDDPVVGVSLEDAEAFCQWLTRKEKASGSISSSQAYRLPTLEDYINAAGDAEKLWDTEWPPQSVVGNFGGTELGEVSSPPADPTEDLRSSNYTDRYVITAPVGSFRANANAIYDLRGNVREWIGGSNYETFGGSWIDVSRESLKLKASGSRGNGIGQAFIGFRVVLDGGD